MTKYEVCKWIVLAGRALESEAYYSPYRTGSANIALNLSDLLAVSGPDQVRARIRQLRDSTPRPGPKVRALLIFAQRLIREVDKRPVMNVKDEPQIYGGNELH